MKGSLPFSPSSTPLFFSISLLDKPKISFRYGLELAYINAA